MQKQNSNAMENPFQTLHQKLNQIEELVLELKSNHSEKPTVPTNDLLSIDQASEMLNLAKATIYSLSSTAKIPVIKKGKRLYFSRKELIDWLNTGRKKTVDEIQSEAQNYSLRSRYRSR